MTFVGYSLIVDFLLGTRILSGLQGINKIEDLVEIFLLNYNILESDI